MKDVAPEDRPKVGQMVNDVRGLLREDWREAKTALAKKAREEQLKREVIDVTPSGQEEQCGPQPSEYHCPGRGGAHFRGNGI